MLSKKVPSLVLSLGLIFGLSSGVGAANTSDILESFDDMLAIPGCVRMFNKNVLKEVKTTCTTSSEVTNFCYQFEKFANEKGKSLASEKLVNILKMNFEILYNTNPEFKKVVDKAWTFDTESGEKEHASISHGVIKNLSGLSRKKVCRKTYSREF